MIFVIHRLGGDVHQIYIHTLAWVLRKLKHEGGSFAVFANFAVMGLSI